MKKSLEMILLLSGFLFPAFGAAKVKAEETKTKEAIKLEESIKEPMDYSVKNTRFLPWPINIEKDKADISSYQELVSQAKNLSEKEKLIEASKMSSSSVWADVGSAKVMPQDYFFYSLQNPQDSLSVGNCRHIATHTERFLNDVGIKSAAVTGINENGIDHAYVISKTKKGTAIIDYSDILTADTKNIEKILESYQEYRGTKTFEHLFFENSKFKYKLVTEDGRNFLDFIGYDESSEPLKNSLIHNTPEFHPKTFLNLGKTLNFNRVQPTKGISSRTRKSGETYFISSKFKKDFSISDFIKINSDIGIIKGDIDNNQVSGINGNLVVNTCREKGFNLGSRIALNKSEINRANLFYDLNLGIGASYKILIKNIKIEPYIVSQLTSFLKDMGTYNPELKPTETVTGINLASKVNGTSISLEPYLLSRIWENGFGANAKLGNKYFGINASGEITESNYKFCPHKKDLTIGAHLNLGNLTTEMNYKINNTNYDGEKESRQYLNLASAIKF